MLTRKSAINTVRMFIKDMKNSGYKPSEAWLFGSVVSGKIHEYSDIDLALWDKSFTGILHQDIEKLKQILVKYNTIELHTYSEKENEKNNPFIGEIKKTGKRIL